VIGIPAGMLCGRVAWLIFAHHLGILPVLAVPLSQFAVVAGGALLLALAIAALPGESAARARPAQVLTGE
jgi:ABC-type lipoprotein release transport system permease subunit